MNKLFYRSFAIFFMVTVGGCAPLSNLTFQQIHAPAMVAQFREKGQRYEKDGELYNALYALKVADSLEPGNPEIKDGIKTLKNKSQRLAEHYYQKGIVSLKNNALDQAAVDLMKSLRYDPAKTDISNLLESYYSDEILARYIVKKGDTFQSISSHFFAATTLSGLIAHYNNLQAGTPPKPGTALLIPLLDNKIKSQIIDIKDALRTAQQALSSDQYEEAIETAEKVYQTYSDNDQAKEVINEALLRKAEELIEQEHFLDALAVLEQVTENYKDTESKIVKLQKRIRWEAEKHYKAGVKYFVKEQLNLAIQEWNRTLELNPDHPKALSDLELAQSLLARLQKLQR